MQFAMFNAPLMIRAVDLLSDDPSFYQLIEQNPGKRSYREVIFLFFFNSLMLSTKNNFSRKKRQVLSLVMKTRVGLCWASFSLVVNDNASLPVDHLLMLHQRKPEAEKEQLLSSRFSRDRSLLFPGPLTWLLTLKGYYNFGVCLPHLARLSFLYWSCNTQHKTQSRVESWCVSLSVCVFVLKKANEIEEQVALFFSSNLLPCTPFSHLQV